MKPTASNVHLLLNCARPFDDGVEVEKEEPSIAMRYGSAFHLLMQPWTTAAPVEEACKKYGVEVYADELLAHATKAKEALYRWLNGENTYGLKFEPIAHEVPAAWNWATLTTRTDVKFDEASHTYETSLLELAGTADLVADTISSKEHPVVDVKRVVFDYKTGDYGDFTRPDEIAQLRALAVMWDADIVAVLHAPRSAPVTIYTANFSPLKKAVTVSALQTAMRRIGDGSLRPGPHCKHCPARVGCPVNNADLVKEANMLVRMATGGGPLANPVDKGALSQFLRLFGSLEKQARELLKADVRAGEVIQEPTGKTLQLQRVRVERLSKASVLRAFGSEGEAELQRLREKGALVETEEERLVAK